MITLIHTSLLTGNVLPRCYFAADEGPPNGTCKRTFEGEVESSWNVMAHGDAREGKWRGNWRMEWVASTLHTTPELGVPSITTADAHTSPISSRLNGRPCRFKWTRPFRRKTKSGFCACAITFQTQSSTYTASPVRQRIYRRSRTIRLKIGETSSTTFPTATLLRKYPVLAFGSL